MTASVPRPASTCWSRTTPADFAAAVTRLLRDPAERDRLGESARRFAAERYAPAVSAAALEREHLALAGAPALTRRSAG